MPSIPSANCQVSRNTPLMLKRGLTGTLFLWQWRQEVRDGGTAFPPVRNVVIQLQDEQHRNVYKWTLTNAWCTKLSGPSLKDRATRSRSRPWNWPMTALIYPSRQPSAWRVPGVYGATQPRLP